MLSNDSIRLRPVEHNDLAFLRDLANDPDVRANVVGWDWPLSLAGQERWFESGIDTASTRRLLIESVEDGRPIGLTGLWDIDLQSGNAMTAIKIGGAAENRGRGYGQQAVRMVMDFAFRDVGLNRLYGSILEFNAASMALYFDKCGWTHEGVSRKHVWRNGQYWDVINLGILREEFLAQELARGTR